MDKTVFIIGAGLAGSEAALQLANRGFNVHLFEMRGYIQNPIHKTNKCAELVCSNSLKSTKENSAAGMLKTELNMLGSFLLDYAYETRVPAGGALALNREDFSNLVTEAINNHDNIRYVCAEVLSISHEGKLELRDAEHEAPYFYQETPDAILITSGPLTSDGFASFLQGITGSEQMAFYDAAAPIVMADSLNWEKIFVQNRYEDSESGDYANAAFTQEQYEIFAEELIKAQCVIKRNFETKDLFQACQPIEEIMRKGFDAPRFGPLKPVGLTDPTTGRRPWAVVQLRAEDKNKQSYNLVGFQTNLTFPEQKRVFSMIPGLENAEFARYGVMHRNTFIQAPKLLDNTLRLVNKCSVDKEESDKKASKKEELNSEELKTDEAFEDNPCGSNKIDSLSVPVFLAGQLSGTEGYCEAIATGLYSSLSITALLRGVTMKPLPEESVLGSLLAYATNKETTDYQPMHVNFGILAPIEPKIRNKQQRYTAYAQRGFKAMEHYLAELKELGLVE